MSALTTEQLSQLIAHRHECLLALRDLGHRQRVLVAENDLSQLLKLLSTKQQLLGMLSRLEQGLAPFRDQHPEHRHWASNEDRNRCARLANECQTLLAEIVAQEAESEQILRERRDETAIQLNSARSAITARQAYLATPQIASGSLDLTAE